MPYRDHSPQMKSKLFSNILYIFSLLLLAACIPRHSPHYLDKAEIRMDGDKICLGKNEYKSNPQKYKFLSINISILHRSKNPNPGDVHEENIFNKVYKTENIATTECLSPLKTGEYHLNKRYVIGIAYFDKNYPSPSLWRFLGNFCLYKSEEGIIEIATFKESDDYYEICGIN